MRELRRLAARHAVRGRFGGLGWPIKLALTLTWPARLAAESARCLRMFGVEARSGWGVSLKRQAFDLLALGLGAGLAPRSYYQFQLFLPANRKRAHHYLYAHESPGLFVALNVGRVDPAVEDKRLFAEHCLSHGLPVAATLAWGNRTTIELSKAPWPIGDLVSKPASGARGDGVRLWRQRADWLYERPDGEGMALPRLLIGLATDYGSSDWIVQTALCNHAAIADLSPGGLVTVRIMTAREPAGRSQAFAALLKMPFGDRFTNNVGLSAAITLDTGRVGVAHRYRPLRPCVERHPDTDAPILDRVVPDWPAVKALALAAHDTFASHALLAWDIALTLDGPLLLEANSDWDVVMPQIAGGLPFGGTAFVDFCRLSLAARRDPAAALHQSR